MPIQNNKGTIKSLIKEFFYENLFKKMLTHVDIILVFMQKEIINTFQPFSNYTKIIFLTNGCNFDEISSIQDTNKNIQIKNFINVCYSGAINMRRGLPLIINYLKYRLHKVPINVKLFGRITPRALRNINTYNAEGDIKIEYLGEISFKKSIKMIAESDICLCLLDQNVLNYQYAYAIKIFEYLSLGKIVIATKTHASSEIIKNGINGFLIQNTVEDLDEIIFNIYQNYSTVDLQKISEHAKISSLEYDWNKINQKLANELKNHLFNKYGLMAKAFESR